MKMRTLMMLAAFCMLTSCGTVSKLASSDDGWRFPPNEEEQAIIAANRAQGRKIVIFGEHDPLIVTKFTVTPRWGGDEARFLSMLGDSVQVLSYGTGWHEIVPPGFDKGTAMQRMLDYLGLPLEPSGWLRISCASCWAGS